MYSLTVCSRSIIVLYCLQQNLQQCKYPQGALLQVLLVDSKHESDFDICFDRCREVCLTREHPYIRDGQLSFFDYFKKNKKQKKTMLISYVTIC